MPLIHRIVRGRDRTDGLLAFGLLCAFVALVANVAAASWPFALIDVGLIALFVAGLLEP